VYFPISTNKFQNDNGIFEKWEVKIRFLMQVISPSKCSQMMLLDGVSTKTTEAKAYFVDRYSSLQKLLHRRLSSLDEI
jgi:hypothetical protein